jgi:hypothetical protein
MVERHTAGDELRERAVGRLKKKGPTPVLIAVYLFNFQPDR